jgi:chemotaxis protein MotB
MSDRGWTQNELPPVDGGKTEAEKKRVKILLGGAGVFGVLFIVVFIYACHTRSGRDEARSAAQKLEDENKQLNDALELHRQGKVAVETQLKECTTEKTTTITRVEAELSVCKETAANLKEETDRKMKEFNQVTASFREMIDTGALKVEIRRGQMVVDLPAEVLFPSGSASLTKPGRAAIDKVAAILRKMPGRRFTVAGHTDTYRTVGKEFKGNWDLSAARAVTVVEALIAEKIAPTRLIAAGFGEWAPVASNKGEKGRQQNRRIEIILEPDLSAIKDELPRKPAPRKKPK